MINLSTTICKVKLKNPTILASGILGVTGASLCYVARNGAGAVTSKSVCLNERKGYPNPVILTYDSFMMNAVGLSNPGVDNILDELKYAIKNSNVPVIASFFGSKINEFGIVAEKISEAKPALLEVNISCPNTEDDLGRPFALFAETAAKVTRIVKNNTKIPIAVKLSPNVYDIKEIAKAVEEAGADAISAINTVGPGMTIDIKTAKPILANKTGGISGPAIKPIAVRCVYDIYKTVEIPIIGIGGITYGKDAIEMLMAGASAVGVGSAVYYRNIDVFKKITKEIEEFMKTEGYSNLKEIIGKAHDVK